MIRKVIFESQERRIDSVLAKITFLIISVSPYSLRGLIGSYGRTTAEQGVVKAIDPRKE